MNVNELINKLKLVRCIAGDGQILNEAETMLRILDGQLAFRIDAVTKYQAKVKEQQAEIEALKAENSHLKYEISSGAWNPAELTDEEIHQAITRGFARDGFLSDGIFLEIKELLRKASEK
jgi:hypothetical protein